MALKFSVSALLKGILCFQKQQRGNVLVLTERGQQTLQVLMSVQRQFGSKRILIPESTAAPVVGGLIYMVDLNSACVKGIMPWLV